MASAYSDTVDIYREDSFRQKVLDWHKTIRVDHDGNDPDANTLTFKALNLKNAVPWSARMVVKGKMVNGSTGADLTAGRYKLEHGASIWNNARVALNSEELENCKEPAITAAASALVRKSAVQIERDAPKNAFFPLRHSKYPLETSTIEQASTEPSASVGLEALSVEDYRMHDCLKIIAEGDGTNTMAVSALGIATSGAVGAHAFDDEEIGNIIYMPKSGYYGRIVSRTDANNVVLSPLPPAAIAASTSWRLLVVHSQPFTRGSQLAIKASTDGAGLPIVTSSGEFTYTIDLKDVFGALNTDKILPFANLEFIFEKQTNWKRAIHKAGLTAAGAAAVPDAKFQVTRMFLLIDTVKPRDDVFRADEKKMGEGVEIPMRFLKFGYEVVESTGANVNVDLKIAGKRIKDLWVIPQVKTYYNNQDYPSLMTGEQDMDHLLSANAGGWSHVALHIGDTAFPRHKSYRGHNESYIPEYEALRSSCDLGESEGGAFITYEKFRNGYNWLYFALDQRSDDETLSQDHAPRLEITYETSVDRTYHVLYTYEVAQTYKVGSGTMEKASSYIL